MIYTNTVQEIFPLALNFIMNVSYLFSDQNPTEVTDTEEPENPLNENISDVESTASELGRRIRILGLVNSLG